MKEIKVCKIRENAKLPVRAHPTDVGMDIFYCYDPEFDYTKKIVGSIGMIFLEELTFNMHQGKDICIPAGVSILIPTGIKVLLPEGYEMEVKNKSGVAYKRQLLVGSCVIDPDYRGEIFVNLHNVGKEDQFFNHGDKLAQLVIRKIETPTVAELTEEEYNQNQTERGDGGFGSTGDV
jgi:dUTP pyrophosphatase